MRRKRPLSQLTIENNDISQKRTRNNACKKYDEDPESSTNADTQKRAGTINRMVLRNFMCHSLLEVTLDSNINFITGRNGSGKSSILTALVVGLGAKAAITNRGASLKGFIKEGKNSATIEIALHNAGCTAYQPRIFGKEITIQRNFTAGGNSSYKVKSAMGTIVSTSVKEVQRITSALEIQVDNPVCILNQDTARNFLSTNDSKQKFVLFMRATRLDVLLDEYKKIMDSEMTCEQIYKKKKKVFNALKEQLNDLKKKLDDHRSIVNLKDKLSLYQRELLWAKVRDDEEELHQQQKIVENLEQQYEQLDDNITNRVQKLQGIKDRVNELQQQIVKLKETVEVENRAQLDILHAIDELEQQHKNKSREKHAAQNAILSKTQDCEALKKEIDNFTTNLSKIEQDKLNRLRESADLQEKIKTIQSTIETTSYDVFQMRNNISRIENDERDLQRELEHINGEHNKVCENMNTLKSQSSNNLLLYGRDMPQVVAAIVASKSKFSKMPKGPLGTYINIKDNKWAVAVEEFLGKMLLQAFAVDNKKDSALLMGIFNKYFRQGPKPTIITSKFFDQVHDISRNLVEAPRDCVSMYNAIDMTDPVVGNCIIDQASIEGILLIPSIDRAIELMSDISRVPKNCKQGITITGDKYYPDPNYKTYASMYKQAQYLQVNTLDLIGQYEDKIRELLQKRKDVENQYNDLTKDRLDQQAKFDETTSKLDRLKKACLLAKNKLDQMKSIAEPESANVHSLESELTEIKRSIEQKTVDIEHLGQAMTEIEDSIAEHKARLSNMREASKALVDRIVPLERQILEQTFKKNEFNVNDSFDKKRLAESKRRLESAQSELEQKGMVVTKHVSEARMIGERMDEIRPVPEIVETINNMQRRVHKLEREVDSPEETKRKYEEARDIYKQTTDAMLMLQNNIKDIHLAVVARRNHYKFTEDYFENFFIHNFTNILEFRQFKGTVEIDKNKKVLDLVVIPQQGSQGHTATANLSGGEKSFSTVAFLYALWQCMDFPFYFLDEFDVFMDKVNRARVMEVLIHHAKTRPDLQFVFLTPQDMPSIHDSSVAIQRLDDPERNAMQ